LADVRNDLERFRRVTQDKIDQIQRDAKRNQERLRELQLAMQPLSFDLGSSVQQAVTLMTDSASDSSLDADESIAQARERINAALAQFHEALSEEMRTELTEAVALQENFVAQTLAGLVETRQKAMACVADLHRVADEQVAIVNKFIKAVVEPRARSAIALIGDPEKGKEITIEGLEDVRLAAIQAIRISGEACRPSLTEASVARIGFAIDAVATIVNTVDAFTKARAELRLGMANFVTRDTPTSVRTASDRADQLQRVAEKFTQVMNGKIDELQGLERADLIEHGIAILIAYRESQRARLIAARETIASPLEAKTESEDLKSFARRAMAYARKAIVPLVSTHIVSAKTRDQLSGSVDSIIAANDIVIASIRAQVVAAGGAEPGFNKAIRDFVVELLNQGAGLRQQETALKAKIGTVEKVLIESLRTNDADRNELVRAAQEAVRTADELANIGTSLSETLTSELVDVRRNAEWGIQRFASLI
jgi:hypothetical protein